MADALENALTQLGIVLGAMTGLTRWYSNPPESLSEFPCALAYANTGTLEVVSGGWGRGLHTLTVVIYHSREVLPEAVDAAKVWPYRVFTALAADLTLNSTVDTLVWPLRYRFGPLPYAREMHYGLTLDIPVKINAAITTTA